MNNIKQKVASLVLATTLLSPYTAYAKTIDEVMKDIKIIDTKGNKVQGESVKKNDNFIKIFSGDRNNQPATWGDFSRKVAEQTGQTLESGNSLIGLLMKQSKGKEKLVVTKDEVSNIYRTIIEVNSKNTLNANSKQRIDSIVRSLSPTRNYLLVGDLEHLFSRFDKLEVTNGELTESVVARLVDFKGNSVTLDVIDKGNIVREYFHLSPGTSLREKNTIYELDVQGNTIVSVGATKKTEFGIVTKDKNRLVVGKDEIEPSLKPVKANDYVEYSQEDDKIVVLKNFGQAESYIVKSVDRNDIDTLEGKYIDLDYNYYDVNGVELRTNSIQKNDILNVFPNNEVIVTKDKSSKDLNYNKSNLYIDGKGYSDRDIWVKTNSRAEELSAFKYTDYLDKAEVSFNVKGEPKLIEVKDMLKTMYVTETHSRNKEVEGYVDGSKVTYKESNRVKGDLREDRVYNLIMQDEEIVESESLSSRKFSTSRLGRDYVERGSSRSDRYYVDNDTTVKVTVYDNNEDKKQEPKYEKYEALYNDYEERIGKGFFNIKVYYENDEAFFLEVEEHQDKVDDQPTEENKPETNPIPQKGMSDGNAVEKNNLNIYKLIDMSKTHITITDGETNAKLELPRDANYSVLANLKPDYVTVEFDTRDVITKVREFRVNPATITTKDLNKVLGITSKPMPEKSIPYEKVTDRLYGVDKLGNTFHLVSKEDYRVGDTYFILIKDGLRYNIEKVNLVR